MQVAPKKINGKLYNVILHKGSSVDNLLGRRSVTLTNGVREFFGYADCLDHIATALPPLPRNPTKDDAWLRLLYLYASHGLFAICQYEDEEHMGFYQMWEYKPKRITHVEDAEGNKQEVAIV